MDDQLRHKDGGGILQSRGGSGGAGVKRSMCARRRGPCTPAPSWRLCELSFGDGATAAAAVIPVERAVSMSARKLAARLWELQETPIFTGASKISGSFSRQRKSGESNLQLILPPSPPVNSCSSASAEFPSYPALSKNQQYSAENELWLRQNGGATPTHSNFTKLQVNSSCTHPLLLKDCNNRQTKSTSNLLSEEKVSRAFSGGAQRSGELLKVFSHIHDLEERNPSNTSLAVTLQLKLEQARAQIRDLELAHRAVCKEMDWYLNKFAEEKAIWHSKEKEKARPAIQSLKKELEEERNSKCQLEMINTRIARELGEANVRLSRALQNLERERKARELMEHVCDELAQEIGEGKAEVEELKVNSAKAKEEVEQERKMLQIAEVWREERVQMKLADAGLHLEEKNTALDRLRSELEEFLESQRTAADGMRTSTENDIRKAERLKAKVDAIYLQERKDDFLEAREFDGTRSIDGNYYSVDPIKSSQSHNRRNFEFDYQRDGHEALEVSETGNVLHETVSMLKEQKMKSRRSRFRNRAKAIARSRRNFGCGDTAKDSVVVNQRSVWESASDSDTKPSEDSVINEESGKFEPQANSSKQRTHTGNLSNDGDRNHHIVYNNFEGSPTVTVDEHLTFELTEANSLIPIHQPEVGNYELVSDAFGGKWDSISSEGKSFVVEFGPGSHDGHHQSCDGNSSRTSRTEDTTHATSALPPHNSLQKASSMNKYFAKCIKELAQLKENDGRPKIRAKPIKKIYGKTRKVS